MKLTVNLATRRPIDQTGLRRLRKILIVMACLWLVVILAAMALVGWRHHGVTEKLSALRGQTSAEKDAAGDIQALQDEVRKAEQILQRRSFRWSLILDHLEKTWVDGIQVRSIEPDFAKKTLAIKVLAKNDAVFRKYLGNLLEYEGYSQVLLLRQEKVDIKDDAGRTLAVLSCEVRIQGAF